MAENEEKAQEKKSNHAFIAIVTALVLIFLSICGYIFFLVKTPKEEAAKLQKSDIGIIRIKDAIKSHKDYAEVQKLQEEYESLMTEMMSLEAPIEIKLPEPEKEAFVDSAKQKLSQTIVDKIAVLEEKRRVAIEKYKKDTEANYEARRAEIDSRYLNAIADLRMKLDNSDILHLSNEQITEFSRQLDGLQHERGEAQDALKAEREQEIYNYGEQVVADLKGEFAQIDQEASKLMVEASLKETESIDRNMRLLDESMAKRQIDAKEKEEKLDKIKEDLKNIEDKIFSDIASLAAKHAMQKGLTLVVADVGVNIKTLLPVDAGDEARYSKVTALNAVDITDDVINDLLVDTNE